MKKLIIFVFVIFILFSCNKNDGYFENSQDKFIPLPVKDWNKNNYNILSGEKIKLIDNTKEQGPVRWRDGWVEVNNGNGWVVSGSYMRWLYQPNSNTPLDCYLPMRNCLPTVTISGGIAINEDPNGNNFSFTMDSLNADIINAEYGIAMNEAIDNNLVVENYFQPFDGSKLGLSIHDFINFNNTVQAQIYSKQITFKRFGDNILVVNSTATNSDDCPDYFFDDSYDVQSNY